MKRCKQCGRIPGQAHKCVAPKDFVAKFWSLVKKADGCWLWTGHLNARGYGRTYLGGGRKAGLTLAHRFAWKLMHGEIPDGLDVLHRCDVPACVRGEHLFLGTAKENSQDMARKGRAHLQTASRAVQLASAAHMRAKRGY